MNRRGFLSFLGGATFVAAAPTAFARPPLVGKVIMGGKRYYTLAAALSAATAGAFIVIEAGHEETVEPWDYVMPKGCGFIGVDSSGLRTAPLSESVCEAIARARVE